MKKNPVLKHKQSNNIDKAERAVKMFRKGYLCSQSVFAAFCEDYGINKEVGIRLSRFLGHGYLFRGDYCGAVSAALMIYGLKYSSGEIFDELSDEVFYQVSKEHIRQFSKKNGSCLCNEMLQGDISSPEGIQSIREKGYFDTRCPGFVKDSAEILEQIITKMEQRDSKLYFEEVAPTWDDMQQSFFSDAARTKAYDMASVSSGQLVADIGAGTGYLTEGLIEKGARVIAVDQSPKMLNTMQQKFSESSNIDYRVGDSEDLPIANEELDHVFANMYLHHVVDPEKSIREMVRTLKKNGKLVITDLDEHTHEFLRTEQHDRWLGFKREDIKKWFELAGLKDVVVECVGDNCCALSEKDKEERAAVSIFIAYGRK